MRPPRTGTCVHCGRGLDPFKRCRRSSCPAFNPLWRKDWQVVLQANVSPLPGVLLVTITGPGLDAGLPWDRSLCTHPDGEGCSGRKGCRVLAAAADRWHQDHEPRWSQLHRAAATRARRSHGSGALVAAKTWELQERGVGHLHVVVPYWTPPERSRADAYVQALKELAPRYWFGFVDSSRHFGGENGGARAAGYCAKYIGKTTGERMISRRAAYVGRHLTAETLITMRMLRLRRWAWFLLSSAGADWETIDADPRLPRTWLHLLSGLLANPPPSPALVGST